MGERTIWADIAYAVDYVPRGARNTRRDTVLEKVPLRISEIGLNDAPVALEIIPDERVQERARKSLRAFGGGLIREPTGSGGQRIPPEHLSKCPVTSGTWVVNRGRYPFAKQLPYASPGKHPTRHNALDIRRTVANGRDRALSYANAMADRTCIIDGNLWVPVEPVQWFVKVEMGRHGSVSIYPGHGGSIGVPFDLRDFPAAERFAQWLSSTKELDTHGLPVTRFGNVDVKDDSLVPSVSLLEMALDDLSALEFLGNVTGMTHLPSKAIMAWAEHREGLEALKAGSEEALEATYEPLSRLLAALPKRGALDVGYERPAAEVLASRVPGHLEYHRSYLSTFTPVASPEDLVAMASI